MNRPSAAFLAFRKVTTGLDDLPEAEQIHRLKQELNRALARAAYSQNELDTLKERHDQLRRERDAGATSTKAVAQLRGQLADQTKELAQTKAQTRAVLVENKILEGHCRAFAVLLEDVFHEDIDEILERLEVN